MKNLKQILSTLVIAVLMLGSFSGMAQSFSKIIDLSQIGTNSTQIKYKFGEQKIIGFDVVKDENNNNVITPNLDNTEFTDIRVELYDGKKMVAKYIDNQKGGPNNYDNFIYYENNLPFKTYINSKDEFWSIVAAIVLCCVQAEVAYSQKNGWSGSVGFDCDCFGKSSAPSSPKKIIIGGKEYSVTKIKFIPLNQKINQRAKISISDLSILLK